MNVFCFGFGRAVLGPSVAKLTCFSFYSDNDLTMPKQVETKNNKKLGSAAGADLLKITAGIFTGVEINSFLT